MIAAILAVSWVSALVGGYIGRWIGQLEVEATWRAWVNDQLVKELEEETVTVEPEESAGT